MAKSLIFGLALAFCLHAAVVAQNPHANNANRRASASSAASRLTNSTSARAIDKVRTTRSTQARLSSRGSRSMGESKLRGNRELLRSANELSRRGTNGTTRHQPTEQSRSMQAIGRMPKPGSGIDRAFSQRLASIDRIRDRAVETGNVNLLNRADALEQAARDERRGKRWDPLGNGNLRQNGRDRSVAAGHSDWKTNDNNRPFGQTISEIAREFGKDFGSITSEHARQSGREFGKLNVDKTRADIYRSVVETGTEPPTLEPPSTEPPTQSNEQKGRGAGRRKGLDSGK